MCTHNPGEAALARKGVWDRKRAGRKNADLGVESSSHGPTKPRRILLELDGFLHGAARPDYESTS